MNIETITFDATLDYRVPIRVFIAETANTAQLNKKKTYNLCLAVDEIATNIINHGYLESGIVKGSLDVIITHEDNAFSVVLEDSAVPYDPLVQKLPTGDDLNLPLEERPIGGLGVMIAKQSVDVFNYEFVDNKNRNIFIVNS
jgi:serine/threonine-protein kinase RsbW